MFERFRRSRGTDAGASSLATRERDTTEGTTADDRELDPANDRVGTSRFERVSPGERDRGVTAGGGEDDLAADRAFEREDMARGGDGDTALDRDSARSDLRDGDVTPGGGTAAAGTTADDRTTVRDDMATLRKVAIERPPDAPTDWTRAAAAARERVMNRLAERLEAHAG